MPHIAHAARPARGRRIRCLILKARAIHRSADPGQLSSLEKLLAGEPESHRTFGKIRGHDLGFAGGISALGQFAPEPGPRPAPAR